MRRDALDAPGACVDDDDTVTPHAQLRAVLRMGVDERAYYRQLWRCRRACLAPEAGMGVGEGVVVGECWWHRWWGDVRGAETDFNGDKRSSNNSCSKQRGVPAVLRSS